jgi:hypothetical protein
MAKTDQRPPLVPLASTEGEKHAEYKRRRDDQIYIKVPTGGEEPYIADGWAISKRLKKQVRLSKNKNFDMTCPVFSDHG